MRIFSTKVSFRPIFGGKIRVVKKVLKPAYKIFLVVVAILFIAIISFLLWIITEPRSIPSLTTQIEETLNNLSKGTDIHIDNTTVKWEGIKKGLNVYLTGVKVVNTEGITLGIIPEIMLKLNIYKLLVGIIDIKNINIDNPKIRINIEDIKFAKKEKTHIGKRNVIGIYRRTIIDILSTIKENGNKIPIKNIFMNNVQIILENDEKEKIWSFPKVVTKFFLVGNIVTFKTEVVSNIDGKPMHLDVVGALEENKWLRITTGISDISSERLSDIFPEFVWFGKDEMLFNGSGIALLDMDGKLKSIDFDLKTDKFSITQIKVKGFLDIYDDFEGHNNVPKLHLKAKIRNLPTEDIVYFWSPNFAKSARRWITTRVSEAVYTNAEIEMNIPPEEFIKKRFSKDSIDIFVEFENATVDYMSGFPVLDSASGVMALDGNSMNITVTKGKIKDSYVQTANLNIDNMGTKGKAKIEINGKLIGTTNNLIELFKVKQRNTDENLYKAVSKVSGNADTYFNIKFPIKKGVKFSDMEMHISSSISKLHIDDMDKTSELTTNAEIVYNCGGKLGYRNDFIIKAHVDVDELSIFEIPDIDFISGNLGIELIINNRKNERNITGKVDASNAYIDGSAIGWQKPLGDSAEISFNIDDKKHKPFEITSFLFEAKNFTAKGRAVIAKDKRESDEIYFENVRFGENNLELKLTHEMEKQHDYYRIVAKGKGIDISPLLKYSAKSNNVLNVNEPFAIDMIADIDRMVMNNGIEIQNFYGTLKCEVEYCTSADFTGEFIDGGSVDMSFGVIEDGNRKFSLHSDNAGALINGLGIMRHIKGGVLSSSAIAKKGEGGLSNGKVIMKNFMVVKAPMLTKLLTVGSFTGIVDILNGKGISFKKLKGEFNLKSGIFEIRKVKASGNSLGITTDGFIDTKIGKLDLRGSIIPSYTLNSMLGNLPLIGNLLIGREGEGIIATKYSIKGDIKNAKISVNPFSILTPGFLRNIWGGTPETPKADVIKQ